jgi:outer membrane immunogenic protein
VSSNFKKSSLSCLFVSLGLISIESIAQTPFNGFYGGLITGYSLGNFTTSTTTPFVPTGYDEDAGTYFANQTNATNVSNSGSGTTKGQNILGGAVVGYNKNLGDAGIIGGEFDISYIGLSGNQFNSTTYPGFFSEPPPASNISNSANALSTIRAKYGFAKENTLFYVTGGLAITKINSNTSFSDGFVSEANNQSTYKAGWTLGVGTEHMLDKAWSIKAEYLYANFGNISNTSNNLQGQGIGGIVNFSNQPFTTQTKLDMNIFRVGINRYF